MKRIIDKKQLDELVGGDIFSDGGDRNQIKDKEIETGPVDKPFNDYSDYQKGKSTTTDKSKLLKSSCSFTYFATS